MHVLNEKTLMGCLAVVIMLLAYGLQLWKTYRGISEPHPIAWFGFGLLTGIGYLVQYPSAGPGSWVMGLTALFCFLVGSVSQYKRRWRMSDFDSWDWAALIVGIGLFTVYLICKNRSWGLLVSAVLITSADLALYIPIFNKAKMLPEKEYAPSYGLNSLKFVPSLFAMNTYSIETCLYPGAMIVVNAIVVFYLLHRRNTLQNI